MTDVRQSRFDYVILIRATPEKVWKALTDPNVIRVYWFGVSIDCAWEKGAPWKISFPDGKVADAGEIQEIEPGRRIVIQWQNMWNEEMKAEGPSRCTIDLTPVEDAVKLTIAHVIDRPDSKFIAALSVGWPYTLSNLKSLLETGAIATTAHPGH